MRFAFVALIVFLIGSAVGCVSARSNRGYGHGNVDVVGERPPFEIHVVPVQPPQGAESYPAGTAIVGSELRISVGAMKRVEAYFAVLVTRNGARDEIQVIQSEVLGEVIGRCCGIGDSLGNCFDVYTGGEDGCSGTFVPGPGCEFNPCIELPGTIRTPVRVVPSTMCNRRDGKGSICLVEDSNACPGMRLHSGGTIGTKVDGGTIEFASRANEPGFWGTETARCVGSGQISIEEPWDAPILTLEIDLTSTHVEDRSGRPMSVKAKGMTIAFQKTTNGNME